MTHDTRASNDQSASAAGRWMTYSLAAAAGLGAVASESDAEIVYSGIQDISISQFDSLSVNLDGDAYADILLKNYVFNGGNYQGLYVNFFPGKVVGFFSGFGYASALQAGDMIDAAATAGGPFQASMAYGANNPNAEFNNIENGYIGLEFPGLEGNNLFGWIRVSIDNAAGTFIVHDWAYNNVNGEGIQAGAVPAPGTLAFLALGATGLQTLRRRRTA